MYAAYLRENPPVWDNKFDKVLHNQRPFEGGPFVYGREKMMFLPEQYQ